MVPRSHYPSTSVAGVDMAFTRMSTTSQWLSIIVLQLNVLPMCKRHTPLAQRCTCEAQLCDHIATNNPYHSAEPWNILDFMDSDGPSGVNTINNGPFMPRSGFFSSNTSEQNLIPVTPTHMSSPYISSYAFNSSHDARNTGIPFIPTPVSSPSGSSISVGIQPDITQIQAYISDDSFVHYQDNFTNNTYAH
ncbi:uncharacterized protein EV420DRAFT_1642747 [Desarmillaria tabescens]|uniref:Uncharacterized protein n=1 Tax=Armillaria tabescens TaxID=1929756 RepID=A0AA39KCQ1_ARMTA|nr:uncharacterized protein EV420DRAFT_1642747 [Desarmillaria tabescens]KAK0458393.1 hypothetical protein EV420DRAFT_1642747 [Desarmillaria tabescens]